MLSIHIFTTVNKQNFKVTKIENILRIVVKRYLG